MIGADGGSHESADISADNPAKTELLAQLAMLRDAAATTREEYNTTQGGLAGSAVMSRRKSPHRGGVIEAR